ncbi:hypothetical protein CDAR_499411 [Caerostris darwini]|uniref:Uncharacterized protein n=1 Tax=Caerostris darwini TaxID=1538125 RepID=A0AAV4U9P9_9ARAC|nr:hypothetical protein CDAR_499411 [Caerostris darwini]
MTAYQHQFVIWLTCKLPTPLFFLKIIYQVAMLRYLLQHVGCPGAGPPVREGVQGAEGPVPPRDLLPAVLQLLGRAGRRPGVPGKAALQPRHLRLRLPGGGQLPRQAQESG